MENHTFELLLKDLYDKYNPENKKEIPNIINKYVGQELDAVYLFLTKYNYSKHKNYDANLNDLNKVKNLLIEYNSGKRSLIESKAEELSIEETIKNNVEKKISNTAENLNETLIAEIDKFKKEFSTLITKQSTKEDDFEIKLNILYTEHEFKIPSAIKDFSIGTRFLIKGSNGNLIAMEVKNVFCDFISLDNGRYIKEITIDVI